MILKTDRTVLRPWRETDAEALYEYAKDERVGPVAGWQPHKNVEESLEIIRTIFMQDGVYAVTLKGEDKAIGCIGVLTGSRSNFDIGEEEGELSYWIGVPFWGKGLITEVARKIIDHAFEDLKMAKIWCGYFDGNEKSRRVQEKCGFNHHHTCDRTYFPMTDDYRIEHVSLLTRDEWEKRKENYIRSKSS